MTRYLPPAATASPFVVLLASLASCGDPHAASDATFKAALAKHFAAHCIFVTPSVGLSAYPATIDAATDTSRFDALVSAGLLTSAAASAERPGPLGLGTVRTTTKTYALTAAGQSAFHADPATGGFCAGRYDVASVDGFTAPTPSDGRTVSQVTYTVEPHLDAWTSNPAVQDRYGARLASVRRTQDHATMVLLGDGWVPSDDAPSS